MTVRTVCPQCAAALEVEPADASRTVACGACGRHFVPPPPAAAPPPRCDEPAARGGLRWDRLDDEDDRPPRVRPRRRPRPDGSGYAVASLVLGTVSAMIFCCWPVGAVTSVTGLVLGGMGLKSRARRLSIAGLVLCCVGLTFAAGIALVMGAGFAAKVLEDPFVPDKDSPVLPGPTQTAPPFPGPNPPVAPGPRRK